MPVGAQEPWQKNAAGKISDLKRGHSSKCCKSNCFGFMATSNAGHSGGGRCKQRRWTENKDLETQSDHHSGNCADDEKNHHDSPSLKGGDASACRPSFSIPRSGFISILAKERVRRHNCLAATNNFHFSHWNLMHSNPPLGGIMRLTSPSCPSCCASGQMLRCPLLWDLNQNAPATFVTRPIATKDLRVQKKNGLNLPAAAADVSSQMCRQKGRCGLSEIQSRGLIRRLRLPSARGHNCVNPWPPRSPYGNNHSR